MEEQVLQKMIGLYQSQGLDLRQVVNSPMFNALPIEKKIQVIKGLGAQSQVNMKKVTTDDVKKILLGLGLLGIAGMYFKNTGTGFVNRVKEVNAINAQLPPGATKMLAELPSLSMMMMMGGMAASGAERMHSAYRGYKEGEHLRSMNTESPNNILYHLMERDKYVSS